MSERTLVLVKPDGVQRQLVGRILDRYEERGLKIVGLKLMRANRDLAERHYDAHRERPFFAGLVEFITSAPLVALALETAQNIVHASDGPEAATTELGLWFSDGELFDYERDVDRWVLAPGD